MSKLRDEEAKKKRSAKAKEIIETIGAPGKAGVDEAKEFFEKEDKKEEAHDQLQKQILADRRRQKIAYTTTLSQILGGRLKEIPWTLGWRYQVAPTEEGVILEIQAPGSRYFRNAFKATGDIELDFNAVKTFVLRAENLFDRLSGNDMSSVLT